jgi:hypothetical protein
MKLLAAAALALMSTLAHAAITTRSGSHFLVIPAAGSVAGGNGTFFRTELTLVNHADVRRVALTYIERGRESSASTTTFLDLPARAVVVLDDVVATVLGRTGLGTILIQTVDSSNRFDSSGRVDAFARIYTRQPGTSGTVSQSFYAQREEDLRGNASTPSYVLGLKQNASFRTNVGIVNLDPDAAQSFTVNVVGVMRQATFRVDLGARQMTQLSIPEGDFGDLYLVITPDTSLLDPSGEATYAAYGSTVDNVTGDSWSVAATFGFAR